MSVSNFAKTSATMCGVLAGVLLFSAESSAYTAPYAQVAPTVDGVAGELVWEKASWMQLDQLLIDNQSSGMPEPSDFSGRLKVAWSEDYLYLLAEIQDEHFSDTHPNPLANWWDDDTLEIFIDPDASGGIHGGPESAPGQEYNAFAYHVGIDNQVVDIGPDHRGKVRPQLYNDHVQSVWRRSAEAPYPVIWEMRIALFGDDWLPQAGNAAMRLTAGSKIGFMAAYIDADGGNREHFIGSHPVAERAPHGRNWGWIDAGVFGRITLAQ
ncbi:CBM9 family sugar-binding protein [Microbulbifer agarilyticus]|uniref:CBM9 family sugar-binding protein n=1 Tax=Microbulbifer agarilyticus TaxID=260552 RepID=UPI001CD4866E|nr:CBM9 family sugar-binding protein [Microbulbifer agarilyticus]MCA0899547.1 CBM9 family sugar-binding protein [Microbulbifer agarilyticus]